MISKSFHITFILLILEVSIAQLQIIPIRETWQQKIIISIFLVAIVIGIIAIYKLWNQNNSSQANPITRTLFMITTFFITLLVIIPNLNNPEFIKEIKTADQTLYIYHESCFPPDSACECDTYGSLVYRKNQYLPIMHLVLKTDFYVGSVQLNNGELTVKAAGNCDKDVGKTKRTSI